MIRRAAVVYRLGVGGVDWHRPRRRDRCVDDGCPARRQEKVRFTRHLNSLKVVGPCRLTVIIVVKQLGLVVNPLECKGNATSIR